MSLETCYGPELNIFEESADHAKRLVTHFHYFRIRKYKLLPQINTLRLKILNLSISLV